MSNCSFAGTVGPLIFDLPGCSNIEICEININKGCYDCSIKVFDYSIRKIACSIRVHGSVATITPPSDYLSSRAWNLGGTLYVHWKV